MSELVYPVGYPIDEHQAFVVATRREDHPADWQAGYYNLINGEYGELMGQHGPARTLLLQGVNQEEMLEAHPELLEGIKEELGDLLWFDVSAAELLGNDARTLCSDALKVHTGQRFKMESFKDLQDSVCANAHKIEVLTKWGIYYPELPSEHRHVSLLEDPFYLFNRMTFRITRALAKGKFDAPPFTASQMEPIVDLRLAIGDHINTLVYIAHLFGLDIEDVARGNIEKLKHRELYGKA